MRLGFPLTDNIAFWLLLSSQALSNVSSVSVVARDLMIEDISSFSEGRLLDDTFPSHNGQRCKCKREGKVKTKFRRDDDTEEVIINTVELCKELCNGMPKCKAVEFTVYDFDKRTTKNENKTTQCKIYKCDNVKLYKNKWVSKSRICAIKGGPQHSHNM